MHRVRSAKCVFRLWDESHERCIELGVSRGKKRAREEDERVGRQSNSPAPSSSLSPVPDKETLLPLAPPVKKPKRAETRQCPVCSEAIPIRLLPAHAELELQRVEEIIRHIGDADVLAGVDDLEEGPSFKSRRSALKARQSLTALQAPRLSLTSDSTTPTAIVHTITHITRRRKARHARLKELAREDETWLSSHAGGADGGVSCPVCLQTVSGDNDVIEAHVDACLVYESRRAEVARQTGPSRGGGTDGQLVDVDVDIDIDGEANADVGEGSVRTRVITSASLRGTGIHIRPHTLDTEDDIDVDGTDDTIFGDAQFGEEDVLGFNSGFPSQAQADLSLDENMGDIDIDGNDGRQGVNGTERSNHDREAEQQKSAASIRRTESSTPDDIDAEADRLDLAILTARSRGDHLALVTALEAKLKSIAQPPTCRICLSPYVDPTVSTGCWHTCCATCWLRCLASTKLCPMCLRITGAGELRRIYL